MMFKLNHLFSTEDAFCRNCTCDFHAMSRAPLGVEGGLTIHVFVSNVYLLKLLRDRLNKILIDDTRLFPWLYSALLTSTLLNTLQ